MSKTVKAFRITLIVDQGTREFISEASSYADAYGELFEYEKDVEEIEWTIEEECANCDEPVGELTPCEDCNVLHCSSCWELVGCVECGGDDAA